MASEAALFARRCLDAKETGVLDLSDCQLTAVPEALFLMLPDGDCIRKCDLSNNCLKSISSKIAKRFIQMEEFSCASNKNISKLPDGFSKLEKLTDLNLAGNKFSSIPTLCPSLEKLNLSENLITNLSQEDIEQLSKLKEVNVRKNKFDEETMFKLGQLTNVLL